MIIFVGGVHGVGKSTCCAQVASALACMHVRASDIIRQRRTDAVATQGKLVADIDANQALLLQGFEQIKKSAGGTSILLDGHFVLRDLSGSIQRLPSILFAGLGLSQLVCFEDSPLSIAKRMHERDGIAVAASDVAALQTEELNHAQKVAVALQIPLRVLSGFAVHELQKVASP